jgi:ribosomal protein L33
MILPISPNEDKKAIRKAILADPYILSLGFSGAQTFNTNTTDEKLETDKFQLFIYNAPSRTNKLNSATLEQLIQIDISVPLNYASKADLCAEQIIAIFEEYEWENHSAMNVVAPSPAPIACQSGFYCVGVRFSYYTTTKNVKKTI